MTEDTTPTFDFDDWLETGVVAQRTVVLHNDRSVPDKLEVLEARRRVALEASEGDPTAEEQAELAAIDAEAEALYQQWVDSEERWLIRALDSDEIKEIASKHRAPKQPAAPGKNASAAVKAATEAALQEWADKALEIRDLQNLDYVSRAVISVTTSRGVANGITAEQLARLLKRPGRQGDLVKLLKAANEANSADLEPPAPFWHVSSETGPS